MKLGTHDRYRQGSQHRRSGSPMSQLDGSTRCSDSAASGAAAAAIAICTLHGLNTFRAPIASSTGKLTRS